MKKFVKSIAMLLLFAFACSALIVVPTVADITYDAEYIVGVDVEDAGNHAYTRLTDAYSAANAVKADGTFLFTFVGDAYDPTLTLDGGKTIVIEGNGHTLQVNGSLIVQNTKTANIETPKTTVTIQNLHLHYPGSKVQAAVSARTNSNVTMINCSTDTSWNRVFALNNGNCHVTVESGYYLAKETIVNGSYTNTTIANSMTINGGYFEIVPDAITNIKTGFRMGGTTNYVINGGVFYFATGCSIGFDVNATANSLPTITMNGGTFYHVPGQQLFTSANGKTPVMTVTVDGAKFHDSVSGSAHLDASETVFITPTGSVDPVAASELKAKIVTVDGAEIATSVNAALDTAKTNKLFVLLTDDCTATATFDNVVFDTNGHTAANVTGSKVRDGLYGAQVYIQYHKVSDTEAAARILVAYSAEYTEASATLKGSKDSVLLNISKYFTSIQAGGKEVSAVELGGTKIFAIDIVGLTKAEFADASHKLDIDMYATDGVNASMGFFVNLTIQLPDDVLASLS